MTNITKTSEIFFKNEIECNKLTKKIFITNIIATLITWILNTLGIFLFNQFHMTLAFILGEVSLIIPVIFDTLKPTDNTYKKYVYIGGAVSFIVFSNLFLAHHIIPLFAFPTLVSLLYFDKKLIIATNIIYSILLTASQIGSYFIGAVPDNNFSSFKNYIFLGVIVRVVFTMALSNTMIKICHRFIVILNDLISSKEHSDLLEKNQKSINISLDLLDSMGDLEKSSFVMSNTNQRIAEETTGVLQNTVKNVNDINNINKKVSDIVETIQELNNKSEHINSLSENVNDKTIENKDKITIATQNMNKIYHSMDNCKNTIAHFEEQSNEISNIINLITEISAQTKLLSLNASIEAARAGEHGRGFAVVATEINNLSSQTKESVENIAHIIENVITNVGEVVRAMDESVQLTKDGLSSIKIAENASLEITNFNQLMTEEIHGIYDISQKINNNSNDIEHYLYNIKNDMDDNLQMIESVSCATEEGNSCAESLVSMVGIIKNISDNLNRIVN